MYLDNVHTSRSGWRYTYTGAQLLDYASGRLVKACEDERAARELVIGLTRDPQVNPTDRRVEEAKRAVVATATVVEELSVYVHEFARTPNREFSLSSGDVVFLGLVDPQILATVQDAIKPRN